MDAVFAFSRRMERTASHTRAGERTDAGTLWTNREADVQ
jgi:hypothetical protein